MALNIDEIYDLFMWDASYSDEDYSKREQQGIAEAAKLKNIYPFIRPIVAGGKSSKSVWEPCAKVIALKSDEDLKPYFYLLLDWLMDMNWPGADIILDRLSQIPFSKLERELEYHIHLATMENAVSWKLELEQLKEQCKLMDTKLDP